MNRARSKRWKQKIIKFSPPQVLALGFASLIVIGAILLKLPVASTTEVSWLNAFFTATSAITVTGLTVFDIGTDFTLFGQIVLMFMFQIGGLGLMTFAVIILMMLGRKLGIQHRILVQEAFNQTSLGGLFRLVKTLFIYTLIIEGIAFIILSVRWVPEFGLSHGMYVSLFHTISAFNNAGFALWPDSLSRYVGDPVVNLVISGLLIIGGLGFTVLIDIWTKRRFSKLSFHSKLMIIGTILLNVIALILIFVLEYSNPATLGSLPLSDKIWGAYFQAVTPRTAGFNTLPIGEMTTPSLLLILLLMFIGAGSASTGSGIKVTTFMVVLLATVSVLRGKNETVIFKRQIKRQAILKALAIIVVSSIFIYIALFALTITENQPFITILFELMSAFGTVGISMGITADLSVAGKLIIMIMMFIGRIGPLTFAFTLSKRKHKESKIRCPEDDVFIG